MSCANQTQDLPVSYSTDTPSLVSEAVDRTSIEVRERTWKEACAYFKPSMPHQLWDGMHDNGKKFSEIIGDNWGKKCTPHLYALTESDGKGK